MITLSEDKTAYGTLVGLVAELEKDVERVKAARANYSERSLDYARATGEISGYNLTLATIFVTDIWQAGEQAATHYHTYDQVQNVRHVHPNKAELDRYLSSTGMDRMTITACQTAHSG